MKGKSIFSLSDAERVREVLRSFRMADRDEQKNAIACA